MFVALDSILIFGMALALVIGLARSWSGWRTRREHSETGDWVGLLEYLFFNRSIARKPVVGWAHYILVLGFVVFLAVVFLDQADGLLSTLQATVVSFILDLLGFLMLMAVVFFLVKKARDRFQPSPAVMARKSLLTISLIGLIVITGFLSEGARLAIQNEGFDLSAPFGSVVAGLLTDSPVLMQVFIRAHIYLVILFIGTLPFTYMRHIASSAVGILHRTEKTSFPPPKLMERDQLERAEGVENIKWKVFLGVEACVSCGRCIENCPATIAEKPLVPGAIVQQVRERAEQAHLTGKSIVDIIPPDIAWSCTNCLACIEHCPVYSRPMDLISLSRRQLVLGQGEIPEEARAMIRNLELYGDTNGKGAAYRNDWAIGLDIEQLTSINPETDVLLWTGCAGAFHPRASEVTRS